MQKKSEAKQRKMQSMVALSAGFTGMAVSIDSSSNLFIIGELTLLKDVFQLSINLLTIFFEFLYPNLKKVIHSKKTWLINEYKPKSNYILQ